MPSAASGVTLAVPLTAALAALPDGGTGTFPRRPVLAGMAARNVAAQPRHAENAGYLNV